MAALLEDRLGVDVEIAPGELREFSVLVDGKRVARRRRVFGLPGDARILRRVRRAIR